MNVSYNHFILQKQRHDKGDLPSLHSKQKGRIPTEEINLRTHSLTKYNAFLTQCLEDSTRTTNICWMKMSICTVAKAICNSSEMRWALVKNKQTVKIDLVETFMNRIEFWIVLVKSKIWNNICIYIHTIVGHFLATDLMVCSI